MAAPDLFLLQHPCPVDPGPHIRRQHYLLIQSSILRTLLGHSFVQLLDAAKGGGGTGSELGWVLWGSPAPPL